ncbi:MAG TPA: biotin/lipoyl-containing protein, partial [Stellaceae bacterium]|nr:biotin/lipoyl-containing protein [Stellaceae bacterium]
LEMNTRLQVEHPVTELVTGLDLVELQIRVAAGEPLPFAQKDVRLSGWAIEARIYAEDPARNFLPSVGRLTRFAPPSGAGVRLDTGVAEGVEIGLNYDPMIAKLVAYGPDRAAAIDRLGEALDGFQISGLDNNLAFLARVVASERFRRGALSTNFITEEFPRGVAPPQRFVEADRAILAAAALAQRRSAERDRAIAGRPAGAEASAPERQIVLLDGRSCEIALYDEPDGRHPHRIEVRRKAHSAATDWQPGERLLRLSLDGSSLILQIERLPGSAFRITHRGVVRRAQVLSPRAAELSALMPKKKAPDTSRLLLSPMPGLLSAIVVSPGQEVKAGEPLAIVEAMKMENVLAAERDGRIAKIRAKAGDSLSVDQVILEFE